MLFGETCDTKSASDIRTQNELQSIIPASSVGFYAETIKKAAENLNRNFQLL